MLTAKSKPQEVGQRLKELRKSRVLTLSQLAAKANISVSSLSQAERGLVSPTVRTIYSVCEALGVSAAWIIDPEGAKDHDPDGGYIVRAARRKEILNTHGVIKHDASHSADSLYKAFIVTVEPRGSSGDELYSHTGEEIGIILSGNLVLVIGEREYRIAKGDTFAFPSELPHRFYNETSAPTSVFWVNSKK